MFRLARRALEIILDSRRLKQQVEMQGLYPAGHYYSPIPDREELLNLLSNQSPPPREIPGIDLNRPQQQALLHQFHQYYSDLPFPESLTEGTRFFYDNGWFCHADAIFLYSFLRHFRPKRIIEIGSGFSSAVMLETVERFFPEPPRMTFVDPDTSRLRTLLKDSDSTRAEILESRLQDLPQNIFDSLESGDLLFIDSSHIVKFGSDVYLLLFEILPRLKPGVFVHFHDVFYPFVYPDEWHRQGRYWNENYFLRAFLSWNTAWEIVFFNTYVALEFEDELRREMPLCLKNTGGSLYLRRKHPSTP